MNTLVRAVSLTALAASAAGAQQPAVGRDSTRLDPVVVTASRTSEQASTASATVTVIRGEDLRARGVTTVADALREVPGLAVVSTGPAGAATSVFARGGNSNFLKVLVDGIPLNEAGGAFNFAHLPTTNVDRIEVVRGPASVLYGSDAVAGVIQIFTRSGGDGMRSAELRGGSRETVQGRAEFSGTNAIRWSAGAGHLGTRGIYDLNNRYRNDDASASLAGTPVRATNARLTIRAQRARYHFPTTGSGAPTDSNAFTSERRQVIGLDVSRDLRSWLRLNAGGGWSALQRISDDSPNSPGDSLGFYSHSEARTRRAHTDVRFTAVRSDVAELTVGGERAWQREQNESFSRFASFAPLDTSFDQERGSTAAFAQAVLTRGSLLRAVLGARLDDNDRFGTFQTWRGSVAFTPVARLTLRAAAGTAFREPAFSETFSTAFTTGDPALEPERTRNIEGAVSIRPSDWLRVGATVFAQEFENLIQYVGRPDPAQPDYENLAAATARGLEIESELSLGNLYGAAGFTHLRTRVSSAGTGAGGTFVHGQPLLRRPARSASATVGFRGQRSVSLTAVHTGERSDRDFNAFPATPVILAPYTRYDAAAAAAIPGIGYAPQITLRVENLTNVAYENVFGFRTPNRTVLVGVRANW